MNARKKPRTIRCLWLVASILALVVSYLCQGFAAAERTRVGVGALAGHRYCVTAFTDNGRAYADDFESLVNLLVYTDVLDLEGMRQSQSPASTEITDN
jgi:hypothetical protein